MSDFWAFNIAGYFLPLILRAKGVDVEQSTDDTYRSYVWICKWQRVSRPTALFPAAPTEDFLL